MDPLLGLDNQNFTNSLTTQQVDVFCYMIERLARLVRRLTVYLDQFKEEPISLTHGWLPEPQPSLEKILIVPT